MGHLFLRNVILMCWSGIGWLQDVIASRALDLGCSVGRSTFELASIFEEVIGIDFSHALIAKAEQLKCDGKASYKLLIEGDIATEMEAVVNPDVVRIIRKEVVIVTLLIVIHTSNHCLSLYTVIWENFV